jgi:hypothetical protein
MLSTFERIRGLVFLMSWDNFEEDVLAKLTLANILWGARETSVGSSYPLVSKAEQVAFQVKQAWWALSKLHPNLASKYILLCMLPSFLTLFPQPKTLNPHSKLSTRFVNLFSPR